MKENVILRRHFQARGPDGKGIVRATAELAGFAGQAPYFSLVETGGCANHERILAALPELQPIAVLHLCDEHGAPSAAVDNALYFASKCQTETLARHLRIETAEAEALVGRWFVEEARQRAALAEQFRTEIIAPLGAALAPVQKILATATGRSLVKLSEELLRDAKPLAELLRVHKEAVPALAEFYGYFKWYILRKPPESLAVRADIRARAGDGDLGREVIGGMKQLTKVLEPWLQPGGADEAQRSYIAPRLREAMRAWLEQQIGPLRRIWQMQADWAKTFLAEPDRMLPDPEGPVTGPAVRQDGDLIEVEGVYAGGYLPQIRLGSEEYCLAENREQAGAAAVRYWRALADNDPKEFACLVGEETLVQWGMGRAAGPGSAKVSSLGEWLELLRAAPEETFATYNGQETTLEINRALAEALGYEWDPAWLWMSVKAYRSN